MWLSQQKARLFAYLLIFKNVSAVFRSGYLKFQLNKVSSFKITALDIKTSEKLICTANIENKSKVLIYICNHNFSLHLSSTEIWLKMFANDWPIK